MHLHSIPPDDGPETFQDACWREFWEIIGKAAYRIYREDQLTADSTGFDTLDAEAA
ncbi:hypothetical protein [Streptomyces sp. NPDC004528]|uniref:hypothetical protein n=1 Tax=Streptomyces sp. NPDC004528 TaxID=3154550 RepID=UPI0033A81534